MDANKPKLARTKLDGTLDFDFALWSTRGRKSDTDDGSGAPAAPAVLPELELGISWSKREERQEEDRRKNNEMVKSIYQLKRNSKGRIDTRPFS